MTTFASDETVDRQEKVDKFEVQMIESEVDDTLHRITFVALNDVVREYSDWNLVMAATLRDAKEKLMKTLATGPISFGSVASLLFSIHSEGFQPSRVELAIINKLVVLLTQDFALGCDYDSTSMMPVLYISSLCNGIDKIKKDLSMNTTATSSNMGSKMIEKKSQLKEKGPSSNISKSTLPAPQQPQKRPRIKLVHSRNPTQDTTDVKYIREEKTNLVNQGLSVDSGPTVPNEIGGAGEESDAAFTNSTKFRRGNRDHLDCTEWEPMELLSALEAMRDAYAVHNSRLNADVKQELVKAHNDRFNGQNNSKGKPCGKRTWESIRQQKPKLTENVGRTMDEAIASLRDLVNCGKTSMGSDICAAKKGRRSALIDTKRKASEDDTSPLPSMKRKMTSSIWQN